MKPITSNSKSNGLLLLLLATKYKTLVRVFSYRTQTVIKGLRSYHKKMTWHHFLRLIDSVELGWGKQLGQGHLSYQLRLQTWKRRAWNHATAKTMRTPRYLHRRTSVIFSFRKLVRSSCFDDQQKRQRNRYDVSSSTKFHLSSATVSEMRYHVAKRRR